jgi:microcompartment protein CcmL/EutN
MKKPAIGIVELNSVAAGFYSTDAMVKKAKVSILKSTPICAGKYMILINGDEADVEEAMAEGLETAGHFVVDTVTIHNVHPDVAPAIIGMTTVEGIDSIGVLETFSVASTIIAADAAAKETPVKLIELRLANGLGGKSYFTMTGDLSDVQSSMSRAKDTAKDMGMYVNDRIIAIPHEDMDEVVL